jgi:hypothetical protein
MAAIHEPQPVKLICGMITARLEYFSAARSMLKKQFGREDVVSAIMPFDFTDYYCAEMGNPLLRQFVAYEFLIDPGRLGDIKRRTNELEEQIASLPGRSVSRPINLDPGYLTLAKLVLGSMKDFAHRIYLGGGVYAEVTLQYRNGWQKLDWTFPDYASGRYDPFFNKARQTLHEQYQSASKETAP